MKKPPVVVPLPKLYARLQPPHTPPAQKPAAPSKDFCHFLHALAALAGRTNASVPTQALRCPYMLEDYDSARRPALRSDKSTPPQNGDYRGHRRAPHRGLSRLAVPLLARGVDRWQFLQGSPEAGLQHGLRHLDERSQQGETSGSIREVPV